MHNVSVLLGILIRHLRVKTLAVKLQIFFRLFFFVRGKYTTMFSKITKSGIKANSNFDFMKTNRDLNETNK